MPGFGRTRYQVSKDFTKPAAAAMLAVFSLTLLSFGISWILDETMDRWAHRSPAAAHPYPIHAAGNVTYYVSLSPGWYLNHSLWLHFAGLAVCFIIAFLVGARWKRVR